MTTDYTIRPFTPDDVDAIVNLLQISLETPGIPRSSEFFRWKHLANPFGPSIGLLAESNRKLIGFRAFLKWNWKSGGEVILSGRAVDTVTHPDWRGKGIFGSLTTQLLRIISQERCSFIFNTPNSISLPGYLKLGWERVTRLPLWVYPWKFFRASKKSFDQANTQPFIEFLNGCDADTCLRTFTFEKKLHTVRSRSFLMWRYGEIPGFDYRGKWATEGDASALLIYRDRGRKRFRESSISELLLSPHPASVPLGVRLVRELIQESRSHYTIALAAEESPEATVLKNAGFIRAGKRGPVFVIRALDKELKTRLMNWDNWRCSIGDVEIF